MAKIILALWCSGVGLLVCPALAAAQSDLPALVKAWRTGPTPARRAAIERYAAAHARDSKGPLAELALGIGSYEQKDYPAAITALRKANVPKLADYVAFYLGAARVDSHDAVSAADFAAVHTDAVSSPLEARAWLEEARAWQTAKPSEAAAILQAHYARLPEPDGDLLLADCYRAAGDLPQAARYDQRVYDRYLSGDAANRAAAALASLREAMGAAYPQPSAARRLERADRLLAARDSARARLEYEEIARDAQGLDRDEARVRMGEADLAAGQASAAARYLNSLEGLQPEADGERLYYLTECARRVSDDAALMDAVHRLGAQYPHSPWYLKALGGAGSHFLAANQPAEYVPLYQAALENFPDDAAAGLYHWRIAFHAYLAGAADAPELLRDQLLLYPQDESTGAALYFLGRLKERQNDFAAAHACYLRITGAFENHYYSILGRERLAQPEVAGATPDPATAQFLEGIALNHPDPISTEPTAATAVRIARSRLLRAAGLDDLADAELRFGARNGGQPVLLGMEIAGAADAAGTAHYGVHIMKLLAPEYLNLRFSDAPRKFWELLFPLPYRGPLTLYAHQHDLDPYLLAGLIRQESEFDPQALSHANAYGLTQVLPSTGRIYARKAGIQRFSSRMLWEPVMNLRIGSSIFRGMLDQNGGHVEQTLAAYNAGPNRAAEWTSWNQYREPAEFVESIPYNETRHYVQAVLRNADIYRRLYSEPAASPVKRAASPVKRAASPVK